MTNRYLVRSPIPYLGYAEEQPEVMLWGISQEDSSAYTTFSHEQYYYICEIDEKHFERFLWRNTSMDIYNLSIGLMKCSFVATSLVYVAGQKYEFFASVWDIVHDAYIKYKKQYLGAWLYYMYKNFPVHNNSLSEVCLMWNIASTFHMAAFDFPLVYQDVMDDKLLISDVREIAGGQNTKQRNFVDDKYRRQTYVESSLDQLYEILCADGVVSEAFTLPIDVMRKLQSVPIPENE